MSMSKQPEDRADMAPTYDDHADEHITSTPPSTTPKAQNGAAPIVTVQPIRRNDLQPSYAYVSDSADLSGHSGYAAFQAGLGNCIGTLGIIPCCPCPNPFKSVDQGQVGLISTFGKFSRAVDPGLVRVNPVTESIRRVDVKIQVMPVPSQTVMTRDNVYVSIDSVVVWHVVNPYRAAFSVADVRQALSERAQTTLRQVIGGRNLQQVITERETIAAEISEIVEKVAMAWGVEVESILIKDVSFSQELQQSLSSAATQKRIGESKVIAARAEVDAARLMREAADILSSPAAIQIRQLEALQAMARTSGAKVVFVPMSLQSMGSVEASNLSQSSASNAGLLSAMANSV